MALEVGLAGRVVLPGGGRLIEMVAWCIPRLMKAVFIASIITSACGLCYKSKHTDDAVGLG